MDRMSVLGNSVVTLVLKGVLKGVPKGVLRCTEVKS